MSPRLAYYLWDSATYLADTWRQNLDDPRELLSELPPAVARVADDAWLERFTACFDAVADRIAEGPTLRGVTRCTGDEMALHLVIELAEAFVPDGAFEHSEQLGELPVYDEEDEDFDGARDALLPDHDVLILFDPSLDGIEDSDSPENALYRLVNLHPKKWFDPFAEDE